VFVGGHEGRIIGGLVERGKLLKRDVPQEVARPRR
jgi:hypothetical protein